MGTELVKTLQDYSEGDIISIIPKFMDIEGNIIKTSSIVGFSKLKTFNSGTLACDWVWGFDVYTETNKIKVKLDSKLGNNKEDIAKAESILKSYVDKWKESL